MDIYEQIVRLRQTGQKAVLATIVRHLGSTPRKDPAKMLVHQDGSILGSVGGGRTESQVLEAAQQVLLTAQPCLLKFELTEQDAEEDGLICGGTVEVFIEPILPDPKVILMGAGHLGQAIGQLAHQVGFRVVVIDDRDSFANRKYFPQAEEVVVGDFEKSLDGVAVAENSFILIVTRGHRYDQSALEKALQTPARYVGMVGSRRKIKIIVENLLSKGIEPQAFSRLYAPIGLEIGSETPQEIAVSTVAEMIAIRKGVHQRNSKQLFANKVVEDARERVSE